MFLRNKKSYIAIGIVAAVFLAGILFLDYKKNDTPKAEAAGEMWYNSYWYYRKKITIDHTKVADVANPSATYADFPVLISFSGLTDVNANGTDIRFTSSDGTTELPREIESYSSGTLNAWVKVNLTKDSSDSADDIIYMYYGNPGASEPAANSAYGSQNVWPASIKMVQHLEEADIDGGAGDIKDSTLNANNGTTSGMNSADQVAGKIGYGLDFDGTNNYIYAVNNPSLNIANNVTISAWVNWINPSVGGKQQIAIGRAGNWRFGSQGDDANWGFYAPPAYAPVLEPWKWIPSNAPAPAHNSWHYMVYTYSNPTATIYKDGSQIKQQPASGNLAATDNVFIGAQSQDATSGNFFGGKIDEVRIYNRALSIDEIKTQYNNQNSPGSFYSAVDENAASFYSFLSTNNVKGFAWSENIGWISFNSKNCDVNGNNTYEGAGEGAPLGCPASGAVIPYGVTVDLDPVSPTYKQLFGYAWSANIGWITFNKPIAGIPPAAPYNNNDQDYIAKFNGSDNLIGWARALSYGGGWNGWIKLNNAAPAYGATLNGLSEFEGFAWSDMVTGWISFNSKDCDPNGDGNPNDGPVNCAEAGRDYVLNPIPNYRVYLDIIVNNPPTATAGVVGQPDYCNLSATAVSFSPTFNWTFSDPLDAGSVQTAYQVQVATDNLFTIGPGGSVIHDSAQINSASTAYAPSIPLTYGQTYYWRVRVWDNAATPAPSAYDGSSFGSPIHAYPAVNFSYTPSSPSIGLPTDFTDGSECYDNSNNVIDCANWSWNFGDGSLPITINNPPASNGDISHTYTTTGNYTVRLTVIDSTPLAQNGPFSCYAEQTLDSTGLLWEEVTP